MSDSILLGPLAILGFMAIIGVLGAFFSALIAGIGGDRDAWIVVGGICATCAVFYLAGQVR